MNDVGHIYEFTSKTYEPTTSVDAISHIIRKNKHRITGKVLIHHDSGVVDVTGSVDFDDMHFMHIPVQFGIITESLNLSFTPILNLKGCPRAVKLLNISFNNHITSLDIFPDKVKTFACVNCGLINRRELYKVLDVVTGRIYYESHFQHEDKDQLKRDRDRYLSLQHDELDNLDL